MIDLENFSLECHFKDHDEMEDWIDSLKPSDRKKLKSVYVKFDDGTDGVVKFEE